MEIKCIRNNFKTKRIISFFQVSEEIKRLFVTNKETNNELNN
jgi:hypothetical protein